ncbi:MAG: hypothetical protein ACJAUV_001187 [Flavobacteriales bacterium]
MSYWHETTSIRIGCFVKSIVTLHHNMEAPKIPSLFKFGRSSGPNRFKFPARYYDERKERLKNRYDQMKQEVSADELTREQTKDRMRASIDDKWKRNTYQKASALRQVRVLVLILCLGLIAYYSYYKLLN